MKKNKFQAPKTVIKDVEGLTKQDQEGPFVPEKAVQAGFFQYLLFIILLAAIGFVGWLYINGVISRDAIPPLPAIIPGW